LAPADFERESLADGLATARLDTAQSAFFIWLGVVFYLTRKAVSATLADIARLPVGTQAVFDYLLPLPDLTPQDRDLMARRGRLRAAADEPLITRYTPQEIAAEARRLGFGDCEDLDPSAVASRLLGDADTLAHRREPPLPPPPAGLPGRALRNSDSTARHRTRHGIANGSWINPPGPSEAATTALSPGSGARC